MFSVPAVLSGTREVQVRGLKSRVKPGRCGYAAYSTADGVFQEPRPAAGCQTHIRFWPVSQAISSSYVTVNA